MAGHVGTALACQRAVYALIGSVICLGLNAFFVAAEFALVKVRVTQLEREIRRGNRRARAAKAVLHRLDRYLSVTQFGITVASLGLGWIAEPAIEAFADNVALATRGRTLGPAGHVAVDVVGLGTLTFLHLLIGELVPKFVAIQYPVATTLTSALPLRLVNAVFRPVLWVLEKSQRFVLRLLKIDPDKVNEGTLSEEELIGILAATVARDAKSEDKRRILERVLRFADRPVGQMMIPRVDVVAIPIDASGEEAYELLRKQGFSRVLLTRRSLDDVAGYIYVKDFLVDPSARSRKNLRGLERHVLFFPETRDRLSALRDMQREQTPFAVIVDEYGGTSGIVTMEDLVEEIVGEIRDELDVEPPRIAPVPGVDNAWEVDGRATLDDLRDLGVPIAEECAGEPIGGLVMRELGHLPHPGDVVQLAEGLVAEITVTSRRRIERLRVRLALPPPAAHEA
jgi:CBS domain containing-hemolysin-like protein